MHKKTATPIHPTLEKAREILARLQPPTPVPSRPLLRSSITNKAINVARDNGKLAAGERKVLTAIAQYPSGVSNETLTVLTGYRQTSRYEYTRKLKAAGYITDQGSKWFISDAGLRILGTDYEPLPTGAALRDYWLNRLRGGELAIFKALLGHWPNTVELGRLGEEIGYKQTSRYEFLRKLKARKLVEFIGPRDVRANPELYQ